jgi:hypothetical protein
LSSNVGEGGSTAKVKTANGPEGAIKVTGFRRRYEPASIPVKKGEAVNLAFYALMRATAGRRSSLFKTKH